MFFLPYLYSHKMFAGMALPLCLIFGGFSLSTAYAGAPRFEVPVFIHAPREVLVEKINEALRPAAPADPSDELFMAANRPAQLFEPESALSTYTFDDHTQLGGEGFFLNPDRLPPAVRKNWNSVLLLVGAGEQTAEVATATIVKIYQSGTEAKAVLLTNNHVIQEFCNPFGNCPDLYSLHDLSIDVDTGDASSLSPAAFRVQGAKLLYTSSPPDLALLEIDLSMAQSHVLDPITIDPKSPLFNEALYVIGFPNTSRRKISRNGKIEKQNLLTKRWSTGVFEVFGERSVDGEKYLVHTADLLPGLSGSPVIGAGTGSLIGLNTSILFSEEGFPYQNSHAQEENTKRIAIPGSAIYRWMPHTE